MDENQTLSPEAEAEELAEQARIRREKLAKLAAEGNDPYRKTKYDVTARSDEIKGDFAAFEGKEVSVAGRLMSRRIMGKQGVLLAHPRSERRHPALYHPPGRGRGRVCGV